MWKMAQEPALNSSKTLYWFKNTLQPSRSRVTYVNSDLKIQGLAKGLSVYQKDCLVNMSKGLSF